VGAQRVMRAKHFLIMAFHDIEQQTIDQIKAWIKQ